MIDWHFVILSIKRSRKWPRKTIASKVGVTENTLRSWQKGKSELRYSQGEMLLKLAGSEWQRALS